MASKQSVNINDLSTWTLPITFGFSLVIIAGLFLLFKNLLISDVSSQIVSVDKKVSKEEQLHRKKQRDVANLPHIRKEVEALEKVRDKAKQYLPTEVSMPSLIDNVYLSARKNGIVFKSVTPEADIDTEFYTIKPISLLADVGYISMTSFIEEVTSLTRIMNVHSVEFVAPKNATKEGLNKNSDESLQMKAQLRTYVFKETPTTDVKSK